MNLTSNQQAAVDSTHPLILTLAGPGSGKTRTLVSRIDRLVLNCPPQDIVCITFTNAVAKEIQNRVASNGYREIGKPAFDLGYCGTLHGYCLRLIKAHGRQFGYGDRLTVLTQEQADEILKQTCASVKWKAETEVREVLKRGMFALLADCKTRAFTKAESVANLYFRTLLAGQMLDFDGILHTAQRILQCTTFETPLAEHLMVDEAQDGSDMDFTIYKYLPAVNKCFFADPDQSIYGFRGGNPAHVCRMVENPEYEKHFLEANFRCGQVICQTAQRLIEVNTDRPKKQTVSETGTEGKAISRSFPNPLAERGAIAHAISEMVGGGENESDMAILCRTNAIARDFASFLEAQGIPVHKKKREAFPEDWKAIKNLIALLANPDNNALALFHVEHYQGLDAAKAAELKALTELKTVNAVALRLPYAVSPADCLPILAQNGASRDGLEMVQNVVNKLPAGAGIDELAFAICRDEFNDEEIGEGVTVTTMHAAKGREWKFVFLPSFEQGICPNQRKDSDIAEERRLAYVAFTRAKEYLFMSWCQERTPKWGPRTPAPCAPSQFIAEAGI